MTAIFGLVLFPALASAGEPASVEVLVDQLDDADFARREAALESLAARGAGAIDVLIPAAQTGSPEVASRSVQLLERMMQSDEVSTIDAADAALVSLAESDQPHASALARAALDRNAPIREQRAIARLMELGAQIQYSAEDVTFGRPIVMNPLGEDTEAPEAPALRPRTILLGKEWNGGVDGLAHLRKLSHRSRMIVYIEKGCSVPLAEAQSLASVLPELVVHERGPYLGVAAQTDGLTECLIGDVKEDGPAHKAGLKIGDLVLALNGRRIEHFHDLVESLKEYEAGDTVTVSVRRQALTFDIPVELESWKLAPISDDPATSAQFPGGLIVPPPQFPERPAAPPDAPAAPPPER